MAGKVKLYCEVLRNLHCEIHDANCDDVARAKKRKFITGTTEGTSVEDAIARSIVHFIRNMQTSGVQLERSYYRIMPCVKE